MRLVGPRPETPEYVALYTPEERRVLERQARARGSVDARVHGRGDRLAAAPDPEAYYRTVLMHERVRLDLAYLEKRSLSADARLVLRQAMAIVRQ